MSFRRLYEEYWDGLETYLDSRKDLSPPLLVNPPLGYAEQPLRLCVVGQETRHWYNEELRGVQGAAARDLLMQLYRYCFRLGVKRKNPGVFWGFVRELEVRLRVPRGQVVWTNVNRVDQNGRRPDRAVRKRLRQLFPVLPNEIELAAPHVVVFLTGPMYDRYLERCFPDVQVSRDEELADKLRLLRWPDGRVGFRTFHPRRLRSQKLWKTVLDRIVHHCSSMGVTGSNPD